MGELGKNRRKEVRESLFSACMAGRGFASARPCILGFSQKYSVFHPSVLLWPKKVPCSSSVKACFSSFRLFITIGPYQATGSRRGIPETSSIRTPSAPLAIFISSPLSNKTSVRLTASFGGVVSCQRSASVGWEKGSCSSEKQALPSYT